MKIIFWFRLLITQSFSGIEKLIKNFDGKYGMNWMFAKMLQKKVCEYVRIHKLNLDEVLILLNASHKVNASYCGELLDLQKKLCEIAGRQLIDELKTIGAYADALARVNYVKERAKGYPTHAGYWDEVDSILEEMHTKERDAISREYNKQAETVKRVLNRIIPEQSQV